MQAFNTLKKRSSLLTLIITLSLLGIGSALYATLLNTSSDDDLFTLRYEHAHRLLLTLEPALFLPGSGSNEVRQQLNTTLSSILMSESLSDSDRLKLSEKGIVQLSLFDKQIRTAKLHQHAFETSIDDLSKTLAHTNSNKGTTGELLALYETYNEQSKEALENLEEMRASTETIFLRVRKDNGTLTDDHITYLNEIVPETEKTFDSLFARYQELEKTKRSINQVSKKLFGQGY